MAKRKTSIFIWAILIVGVIALISMRRSQLMERFEASSFPQYSTAKPPPIEINSCPDNTRTDGPCLMKFA
jgi:hypothetical protein